MKFLVQKWSRMLKIRKGNWDQKGCAIDTVWLQPFNHVADIDDQKLGLTSLDNSAEIWVVNTVTIINQNFFLLYYDTKI